MKYTWKVAREERDLILATLKDKAEEARKAARGGPAGFDDIERANQRANNIDELRRRLENVEGK